MEPTTSHLEALRQQLEVWSRLAAALEHAQGALLSGDAAEFERWTELQADCCRDYRRVFREASEPATGGTSADDRAALLAEIGQARRRVRHLNRVHAALLLRASRSLRILRNLLSGSGTPYAPPASLHQVPLLAERE
jgi:hypothetical protein